MVLKVCESGLGSNSGRSFKSSMSALFQTDASRPSALPSANIGARSYDQPPAETSETYLDQVEEDWNKKVDAEVDTLVDGMVDLVAIASVGCNVVTSSLQFHFLSGG